MRDDGAAAQSHKEPGPHGFRSEILVFAMIVVFIWPIVAVGVVGGYGFLVWMYQLIFGPPGPPLVH